MTTTITNETRIIDLTVGQLMDLIARAQAPVKAEESPVEERTPAEGGKRNLVYGIGGIAQLFNCSLTTANRIKASGRIDKAIKQHGRIIVVDADRALELFNQSN